MNIIKQFRTLVCINRLQQVSSSNGTERVNPRLIAAKRKAKHETEFRLAPPVKIDSMSSNTNISSC